MVRRLLLLALVLVAAVLGASSPASAHNSMASSTPEDGSTVTAPLDVARFVFTKDVPLETLTVTLTDPSGVRTTLPGSTHGADAKEVVTPLPALADGAHTLRWRLVSADGHAITGRVSFTVALAVAPAAGGSTVPPPTTTASVAEPVAPEQDEPATTPAVIRWALRFGSYLAIVAVAGVTVAETFLWRAAASPRMRGVVARALAVIAVLALLQLFVLAGDIAGTRAWSAWGTVATAAETSAGMALVVRMALAFAAWVLLTRDRPRDPLIHSQVVLLLSLGMLATWSFAGHARSMRWPWLGVPVDVVHHGAAAAWLGGLAVIGAATVRGNGDARLVEMLRRFSRVAAWSVGLIVATGLLQGLRLGGGPGALFTTAHGRLVLVKIGLLGVMLWFAARNRRTVQHDLQPGAVTPGTLTAARTMVRRELAVGLAILGVTASLVVTSPAAAEASGTAPVGAVTASPAGR